MKLKQLMTISNNLLDYIKFFDSIPDTKPYWNEFIYLYGNRSLTTTIEELYNNDGLGPIGMIFDLKSETWVAADELSNLIKAGLAADTTVTHTKSDTGNITKEATNTGTTNDTDYIIPYDESEEYEQDKRDNINTLNTNESIDNTNNGETVTRYTGFNKEKLNYIKRLMDSYPDIRYKIYLDIVNVLCLQVYDCMI